MSPDSPRPSSASQPGNPSSGPDLRVSFAGIELKNPIIAASGTFGYGIEFEDIVHLDRLGGLVVKGLSVEPMTGNPPPRLYETAAGMLNAIGLQNIGAQAFLDEKLPALREKKNVVVFANVFGYTRADYERTIENSQSRRGDCRLRTECLVPKHSAWRDSVRQRSAVAGRSRAHGETRRPAAADRETLAECHLDCADGARSRGGRCRRDLAGEYVSGDGDRRRKRAVRGSPT